MDALTLGRLGILFGLLVPIGGALAMLTSMLGDSVAEILRAPHAGAGLYSWACHCRRCRIADGIGTAIDAAWALAVGIGAGTFVAVGLYILATGPGR